MSVISVRVPRKLKEKMQKYRDKVNWSEEIRKFIENKILETEREDVISRLDELIKQLPAIPKGTASRYVREDRDGN
jgi:GTP1/Obg family GTP-binding protein